MTDSEPQGQPPNRPLGRRRRANVTGGRHVRVKAEVTPEEQLKLRELAAAQEVTVPRLWVESALASVGETPARRRQAMVELFAIRRVLATNANNLNQLARISNISGEVPVGLGGALVELRRLAGRIDAALDGLAGW